MNNNTKSTAPFWLVSVLLHGVVLAGLVFTPAGQRMFQPEERPLRPEIIRKDENLARVIDDIRSLSVLRLKSQVALLEAGRERMVTNLDTVTAYHQPFVAGQLASVRARLLEAGENTLRLQDEILHAARRAVERQEHGSDPMWRVFDRNRAGLVAGQEEIRRALLLAAPDDAELLALQRKAETAQLNAFQALSASVSAQNRLWNLTNGLRSLEEQKSKHEQELAASLALAGELETELERLRADEHTASQLSRDAQRALAQAKKTLDTTWREKSDDAPAREQVKQAEAATLTARQVADKAKEPRVQAERKQKGALAQILMRKKNLAKNADDTARAHEGIALTRTERDTNAAETVRFQEEALADQRIVYERLLKRLDAPDKAEEPAPAKETTS